MLTFTWWQSGNQLVFTQIDDGLISKECFEGDFPMRIFILSTKYTKHYVASQVELSTRWIKNKFRKYQLLPNLRSYQKWAHFGPDVQGHNRQNIKLVTTQLYAHVLSRRSSFPSGEVEPEKKPLPFFKPLNVQPSFPSLRLSLRRCPGSLIMYGKNNRDAWKAQSTHISAQSCRSDPEVIKMDTGCYVEFRLQSRTLGLFEFPVRYPKNCTGLNYAFLYAFWLLFPPLSIKWSCPPNWYLREVSKHHVILLSSFPVRCKCRRGRGPINNLKNVKFVSRGQSGII